MNLITQPLIFRADGPYCWIRETHPAAPDRHLPPADYVHSTKTDIRRTSFARHAPPKHEGRAP